MTCSFTSAHQHHRRRHDRRRRHTFDQPDKRRDQCRDRRQDDRKRLDQANRSRSQRRPVRRLPWRVPTVLQDRQTGVVQGGSVEQLTHLSAGPGGRLCRLLVKRLDPTLDPSQRPVDLCELIAAGPGDSITVTLFRHHLSPSSLAPRYLGGIRSRVCARTLSSARRVGTACRSGRSPTRSRLRRRSTLHSSPLHPRRSRNASAAHSESKRPGSLCPTERRVGIQNLFHRRGSTSLARPSTGARPLYRGTYDNARGCDNGLFV